MPKRDVHVVKQGSDWAVKLEGANAQSTHTTQREAIDAGRSLARREQSELIVHGSDGKIRQKDSFGNDPRGSG